MAALTKVKLCQLDDLMPFIGATVLIEASVSRYSTFLIAVFTPFKIGTQ